MAKLDCPLQLSPVFLPKIWGRGDLSPIFSSDRVRATLHESRETPPGRPNPATSLIGEAWITGGDSRILNGPVAGLTLAEVSEKYGPELHGKAWKDGRFPILAKYLYTSDWLSVQVHPSDEEAQVHDPGERGKCEMWYTVRRERKGEILLGLKPKTSRAVLRAACSAAKSRDLLNQIHPKEGEAAQRQVQLLPEIALREPEVEPDPDVREPDCLQELREEEHRTPPSAGGRRALRC